MRMTTRWHLFLLGTAAVLAAAPVSGLWAQERAAEALQQSVGLRPEAATPPDESGLDADLGQLEAVQRFPKPDTFTVSTTQQFFYTSNVFYTDHDQVASTAYAGSYSASYVPYSLRDWTPRITLQYNMVRYGSEASGDFDNENAAFSNQYVFSDDRAWTWTASVNASRFTAPHENDHQFYQEIVYDNQISHVTQLLKDTPLFFIASYDLAYHQADPVEFDRLDNTISLSLSYYPIQSVSLSAFVRPAARTYVTNTSTQNGRDDFNLCEGLDATWQICKYASVSADFTQANDYSNNSDQSYDSTSPGVSLTGTLKF